MFAVNPTEAVSKGGEEKIFPICGFWLPHGPSFREGGMKRTKFCFDALLNAHNNIYNGAGLGEELNDIVPLLGETLVTERV